MNIYRNSDDAVSRRRMFPIYVASGTTYAGAPLRTDATYTNALSLATTACTAKIQAIAKNDVAVADSYDPTDLNPAELVEVDPINTETLVAAEYSVATANTFAGSHTVSTTAMDMTSIEALKGFMLYVAAGPGAGNLFGCVTSGTNAITLTTDPNSVGAGANLTTDSYFVKVLPIGAVLADVTSDGLKLKSTAAAGAVPVYVEENQVSFDDGVTWKPLELNGEFMDTCIGTTNVKLRAIIRFTA